MMSPENFAYWLQGYFEISGANELNAKQTQQVKDHLQLVFKKETPDANKFGFNFAPGNENLPHVSC
jgi:hypothetical protein